MRQSKLQAGLDRDEAIARAASPHVWRPEPWENEHGREFIVVADETVGAPAFAISNEANAEHIARFDPAGMGSIFTAMRKVLDEHRNKGGYCDTCRHYDYAYDYDPVPYPCPTVQALEAIYAADPEPRYYTVLVTWSEEDGEHVGICPAFPSLSYLAPGYFDALQGIHQLVQDTIADMNSRGEELPEEV
ncbi:MULTISPECIES: DUF6221 family protein [Nocardia]|uniref:DUF6221 family protein n=1 Tax=Nocardia TaxID=1817 RepID=UPI000D6984BC|nr:MULTISPECIES: DUF6221 family protein [Nocardia]